MQFSLIKNWRAKKDLERITVLHWSFFTLTLMAEVFWIFQHQSFKVSTIFFIVLYIYSLKALKSLSYSFWTFSFFMMGFVLVSLIRHFLLQGTSGPFYFYLLGIVLFLSELYSLHTPIYYPLVNWWEYDFRFRSEIKVKVTVDTGPGLDGRLTDLRRMAGCVVLFEDVDVGKTLEMVTQDKFKDIKIHAEIISKRNPLPGRGFKYGVKFLYQSDTEENEINDFVKYWHRQRNLKRKMRFNIGKDRSL